MYLGYSQTLAAFVEFPVRVILTSTETAPSDTDSDVGSKEYVIAVKSQENRHL